MANLIKSRKVHIFKEKLVIVLFLKSYGYESRICKLYPQLCLQLSLIIFALIGHFAKLGLSNTSVSYATIMTPIFQGRKSEIQRLAQGSELTWSNLQDPDLKDNASAY